jgi:hypothetical protein
MDINYVYAFTPLPEWVLGTTHKAYYPIKFELSVSHLGKINL